VSRPGLTDQAAVLLTERSVRRNAGLGTYVYISLVDESSLLDGNLQFTRDEALKMVRERQLHCDSISSMSFLQLSLFPFTSDMVRSAVEAIKAPLLFIG
jgi:hypothetical protein